LIVRASHRGWRVGFDRYDADDAVAMMVRKSVRGYGVGFDRYDAMTQMTTSITPMTQ